MDSNGAAPARSMIEGRIVKQSTTWPSVFILAFGVIALAFLVAIDRQTWFHIRPATGTAAAMSKASDRVIDDRQAATPYRFSRG